MDLVSHAQNPNVLSRARDFYAVYCASSDGKNYQGNPCPEWDALTDAVRRHWYTVALRSLQLASEEQDDRDLLGNERAIQPNGYVLEHLGNEAHALFVWQQYAGVA